MRRHLTFFATIIVLSACSGGDPSSPSTIKSVTVSAPFTSFKAGESVQLTATARDANGTVMPTGTVSWATSASTVASVNATGLALGLAAGQANITASTGGTSGSLLLTVAPGTPNSATVSMPAYTFSPFTTTIAVGGTVNFDFPAEPHNVIFARVTGAPADIQQTTSRTVSRTFAVVGTFHYDCMLHPGMSGEVVVR